MRLITVVVCLSFLTACGGSSGGSSTTVSPTPISYSGSTLKVFAAEAGGAGVGRIIASNGKEMVMIAPNIVAEIAAANSVDLGGGQSIFRHILSHRLSMDITLEREFIQVLT